MLNSSVQPPCYELTDPFIHYSSSRGRCNVYCRTDRGKKGMQCFFEIHRCNELCCLMRLDRAQPQP